MKYQAAVLLLPNEEKEENRGYRCASYCGVLFLIVLNTAIRWN